jgi:hypothetical protein
MINNKKVSDRLGIKADVMPRALQDFRKQFLLLRMSAATPPNVNATRKREPNKELLRHDGASKRAASAEWRPLRQPTGHPKGLIGSPQMT